MKNLIIVGLSSTSKLAYEFVQTHRLFNVIGFAVNKEYKHVETFKGLPVYSLEKLYLEVGHSDFEVFVALLWNHLNRDRRKLYEYCKAQGFQMANLVSPMAVVRSELNGDNCWIHDFVVVQNDTILESDIMVMAQSLIGAGCHVHSHCFLGAKSLLAGGCTIGEQSFMGLGSIVFDDTHIGAKCIVGGGTTVKRNMPDNSKWITNSDNMVLKQYTAEEVENKLVFSKNVR